MSCLPNCRVHSQVSNAYAIYDDDDKGTSIVSSYFIGADDGYQASWNVFLFWHLCVMSSRAKKTNVQINKLTKR